MKHLLFISSVILFLTSCVSVEKPTVERIEGVELVQVSTKQLEVNAFMVLKNPNRFALDLEKADLKAIVDDIEIASILQTYETEMPANSEFRMPVNIDMDLEKLYRDNPLDAVSKGLKILNDRSLPVHFVGDIAVGKGSAKVTVPVDQTELVKF